ncbi:MAG: carboxymuconolactone decarboxylase family protein [Pseudomonadota bacterium]
MNLENLLDQTPEYAKDLKLNGKTVVLANTVLSKKQSAIIAIACSIATKNQKLLDAVINQFQNDLNEKELTAAKSAAAIMGMNNIYYRFIHLAENKDYSKMPAGLRMNIIANHGIEKVDFELASIAVSAINGCGMCIDSHEKTLKAHNVSSEIIQNAVKIGAVLNGFAFIV